jgi:CDP-4-dehydro-6-deoxyglucose reductase
MPAQPWRTCIVTGVVEETPNTKRYFLQIPELDRFDFEPGQFITFDLPIDEKPGRRLRSYSIASWPDGTNTLELVIVLNETGKGTPWLFEHAVPGAELTLRGPLGVFTLPGTIDKDLYFICTGTGIAPFRSMTHHIFNHQIPHKNIYLIFGTRKFEDLLYHPELKELSEKMEGFHYIPTLSRQQWEGRSGYVHAVYEELLADNPVANFFLCGWKAMIDEAKQRITALGYDKKSIHQELYG